MTYNFTQQETLVSRLHALDCLKLCHVRVKMQFAKMLFEQLLLRFKYRSRKKDCQKYLVKSKTTIELEIKKGKGERDKERT